MTDPISTYTEAITTALVHNRKLERWSDGTEASALNRSVQLEETILTATATLVRELAGVDEESKPWLKSNMLVLGRNEVREELRQYADKLTEGK